jgi:two-component system cell cycle sensor histidine kinase/response regulator CckA
MCSIVRVDRKKQAQPNPSRVRILLIEDEDFVRHISCEVLRGAGFVVLAARTAAEARDVFTAQRGRIALIISDFLLPDANGYALSDEMKKTCPKLKRIIISGYPLVPFKNEGNPCDYLAKPFTRKTLLQKIHAALREPDTGISG